MASASLPQAASSGPEHRVSRPAAGLIAVLVVLVALAAALASVPVADAACSLGLPPSVAVTDFNGDGAKDLAVVDGPRWAGGSSDAKVWVLLGTGTGSFGTPTGFTAHTCTTAVATGDFNGDGHRDLAAANYGSNDVSILKGTGSGSFGAGTDYSLPPSAHGPAAIAVGDFDGDGNQDLAVSDFSSGDVSILLGNGNGSFAPAGRFQLPAASSAPWSIAVGYFDGDGNQDLAVGGLITGSAPYKPVAVLLGDGTGSFSVAGNYSTPSDGVSSVEIGDFNGDGETDLAAADDSFPAVSVFLGTGTGSFGAATNYETPKVNDINGPGSVAIADFNGDGKQDLAANYYASGGAGIALLSGTGTGSFGAPRAYPGVTPGSLVAADFTGDGKPDLAVVPLASLVRVMSNAAPEAQISASPTVALTGDQVQLDASGSTPPLSGAAITNYKWDLDGDGTFETDTGQTATVSTSYDQAGVVSPAVKVTASDGSHDVSSTAIDVRLAPPRGEPGVTINHGAIYTNDPHVTLSPVWPAFTKTILVSNDGGFADSSSLKVGKDVPWTLQTSGPERLPKTVYVRFDGKAPNYTDDIILDQTPPVVDSAQLDNGSAKLPARQPEPKGGRKHTYRLTVRAKDKLSGVKRIKIASKKTRHVKWVRYRKHLKFRGRKPPRYVRVRDGAKNHSHWKRVKR
jgi:hypothetical protein